MLPPSPLSHIASNAIDGPFVGPHVEASQRRRRILRGVPGPVPELVLENGSARQALIRVAKREDAELRALGADGDTTGRQRSLAGALLGSARVPALIVPRLRRSPRARANQVSTGRSPRPGTRGPRLSDGNALEAALTKAEGVDERPATAGCGVDVICRVHLGGPRIHTFTHGRRAAGIAASSHGSRVSQVQPHWPSRPMSVFVWVMIGVALWHFAVLVPDRFYGGIIGALITAVGGALASGYLLPSPGIPTHNPPGITEALWPLPGSILALLGTYLYGARRERAQRMRPHG